MATASVVPYCFPYAIPLLTVLCHRTANPYWAFLPLLIVWVLVPVFDHFLSHRLTAPLARPDPELTARRSFRFVLYLWLPAQALFLLWAGRLAILPNTAALHRTALTLVAGLVSAEGINVAHELLHGTKSERRLGRLLLRFVCYGHFATEHVYGHHRRVATLADPASMRLGESFYKFLPRTVVGGFRSALGYETSRLRAAGRCPLGPENIVLVDIGVSAALLAFAFAFGGAGGARFFLAQAALAVVLLEQVNAIEHYGLTRVHRNGRLEPVGPQHAWDTHGPLSDFLMFRLQAHADHHMRKFHRALSGSELSND